MVKSWNQCSSPPTPARVSGRTGIQLAGNLTATLLFKVPCALKDLMHCHLGTLRDKS